LQGELDHTRNSTKHHARSLLGRSSLNCISTKHDIVPKVELQHYHKLLWDSGSLLKALFKRSHHIWMIFLDYVKKGFVEGLLSHGCPLLPR